MHKWSMILAATPTGVIGDKSGLLWNIPEDMRVFRETTTGHIIVMGRKTFELFPRPLPNRVHVVLTNHPEKYNSSNKNQNVIYTDYAHMTDVLHKIQQKQKPEKNVFIIGGKDIYELFIDQVDEVYLTTVYYIPESDNVVSLSPEFITYINNEFGRKMAIQPKTLSKCGIQYEISLLMGY